ncbi:MAG: hypothetical protein HQL35_14280 [Alphaproteobacteria bacterium]|nr:hypothetical protein [Alphaproteobacteria bacterium]
MADAYLSLLKAFHFTEMQTWIATISMLLFVSNLSGGILSALVFIYSPMLQKRPLVDRISFRLFIMSEVILLVFIFFYHVFMIETIQPDHMVYWASASLMMPLLAVIGSQLMQVIFAGKIKDKEVELKRRLDIIRAQKRDKMKKEQAANGPSKLEQMLAQRAADRKGKS